MNGEIGSLIRITFTLDDLVAQVRKLAEDNPHRVIAGGCTNIQIGTCIPCIVGQALQDCGVPRQWFVDHNAQGSNIYHVLELLGLDTHDNAGLIWLGYVQAHQDSRMPWRLAVDRADLDVRRVRAERQ